MTTYGSPDRFTDEVPPDSSPDVFIEGDTAPSVTPTVVGSAHRAAATLSGHRAVTTDDSGELIYADSTVLSTLERPVGLLLNAVVAGGIGNVVWFGKVTEATWNWTPGESIFLSATGFLTQTPPANPPDEFILEVARVIDTDTIMFETKIPVVLA